MGEKAKDIGVTTIYKRLRATISFWENSDKVNNYNDPYTELKDLNSQYKIPQSTLANLKAYIKTRCFALETYSLIFALFSIFLTFSWEKIEDNILTGVLVGILVIAIGGLIYRFYEHKRNQQLLSIVESYEKNHLTLQETQTNIENQVAESGAETKSNTYNIKIMENEFTITIQRRNQTL